MRPMLNRGSEPGMWKVQKEPPGRPDYGRKLVSLSALELSYYILYSSLQVYLLASPSSKKIILWIGIPLVFAGLAIIYRVFNPDLTAIFPQCPFRLVTGLECPGCGSQRAVHYLLNFNLLSAFRENALLVVSIPYLIGGFFLDNVQTSKSCLLNLKNRFYGRTAIWIVFVTIISFWIVRNL